MKKLLLVFAALAFFAACSGESKPADAKTEETTTTTTTTTTTQPADTSAMKADTTKAGKQSNVRANIFKGVLNGIIAVQYSPKVSKL